MLKEFRAFIAKGNVLDLAVAVIIGAAFAKIVASLTDDIIMPIVGKIFGGLDFSSYFLLLGPIPADYHGSMTDYAALEEGRRAGPWLGHVRDRGGQLPHSRLHHLPDDQGRQQGDAQGRRRAGRPERGRAARPRSGTS